MKYQRLSENKYIVKIERGEEVIKKLEEFCEKEGVENGFFEGVGAVDWAKLAHYNVSKKEYKDFEVEEALEVVSVLGNVFVDEQGKRIIHAHASLGRRDGSLVGGHLVEAKIAAAGEIVFEKLKTRIVKKYDQETGLKLVELS